MAARELLRHAADSKHEFHQLVQQQLARLKYPLSETGDSAPIRYTARGKAMSEVVLVVDDDPVQRRLLEAMVGRFGYRAVVAGSGDAAIGILSRLDTARIDAVVLDLVMPDLDGLGVLSRMREAGFSIPVIVQTAQGGLDSVMSAMRAGATDFVVKPASAERLQVSLRNALAGKALAAEVQRLRGRSEGTPGGFPQFASQNRTPRLIEPAPALAASLPEPDSRPAPSPPHSVELVDPCGNVRPLEHIEREVIRFAISHYQGQMSEVARRLRIGRSSLYRKLESFGFEEA